MGILRHMEKGGLVQAQLLITPLEQFKKTPKT